MNKRIDLIFQDEKPLKYVLVLIGFSLIVFGISIPFLKEWLIAIGDSYAPDGYCCRCRIYIGVYTTSLIIAGTFWSLSLIFQKQIVRFYEKCKVKQKTVLPIVFVLIFIILGLISYLSFKNFPYSMDEYNYLYQAKIFSHGKLFIDNVPENLRPFKEVYMVLKDNKLFSKYPPGFPLILTIGVLLNIPGLINPLIAVIALIIFYLFIKTFLGSNYGLLAVITVSTTPYFLGYSASYYSQPTALLLTVLIFLMLRKYELTSKENYLYLLGLASGFLFMTRPLDSFCAIVPAFVYLLYILYNKENLKIIGYPVITFGIVSALFLTYNYFLVGKITIAPYPVFENEFRIIDPNADNFIQNVFSITRGYINNGIENIPTLFYRYFLIHTGVFIPFFAIFGLFFFKSKWKWILVFNFLMLVIFYNFVGGLGWPQYGARYYYSGFFSLALLSTVFLKEIIEKFKSKNYTVYLLTFVLCIHFLFSINLINDYSYGCKVKLAITEDIKKKCQDNSIVILDMKDNNPTKPDCSRKLSFFRLGSEKRNMFMNTSQLITTIEDPYLDLPKIKAYFPNHSICYYNYGTLNELLTTYSVASN